MKKPNVLYIVGGRSFKSSNPGRKVSEVISNWKKLNINLQVFFGNDLNSLKMANPQSYGHQEFFHQNWRKFRIIHFFINSFSEFKDIFHDFKLGNFISKQTFDTPYSLVVERSSRLHWSGLRLAKKLNVPFVLEWKDNLIPYKFSLFKLFAVYIENLKLKKANYIIIESSVLKKELISIGIKEDKILIALNAVNSDEFLRDNLKGMNFRFNNNIPLDNIVVGYLGSYAFYHNSTLLIKAASIILNKFQNVTFLFVGNGRDFNSCYNLALELGLFNNGLIMLDGVSKDLVPNILSSVDISVLPGSTDIICPIKIMEYMASETAVIVPDYECNREVVSENIGLLFKPGNVEDLVDKISLLINNSELRKKMAFNGREYVKENLSWEQTWNNALNIVLRNEGVY